MRVDVSAARRRLAQLAQGLRAAGGGVAVARAAEKIAEQVRAVADAKLSRHHLSGEAAADTRVDIEGALVVLHGMPPAHGQAWSGRSYLSLQRWWPFRSGMPPFMVKRGSQILAAEVLALLGNRAAPERALAQGIVDEAEEAAANKRDAALKRFDAQIKRREAREERAALRGNGGRRG